ncbi:hypothetical protein QQP08_017361, partial [Theobroma cacao]
MYLSYRDNDLIAFVAETLSRLWLAIEDHNRAAQFVVKDVQLIQPKSNYLFAACLNKDWPSIKRNNLVRSKSTQKEAQVKVFTFYVYVT